MNEPITELDTQHGVPHGGVTPWEETLRVLETAELFWISTVRADGRPHVTPVLTLNMVENSTSPFERMSGWFFRHWMVLIGHLFPRRGSIRVLLLAPSPTPSRHDALPTSGLHSTQAESGGKGQVSTSRAVHRRVVLPAARAFVRCR